MITVLDDDDDVGLIITSTSLSVFKRRQWRR